jgi:chemotaxis protein methyltransferase CheR
MLSFFKKKTVPLVQKSIKIDEDYTDIQRVANYFKNETGVTFDKQIGVLKNKVTTFCRQREIHSFLTLIKIVQDDSVMKQELIDYLTTNETFFIESLNRLKS